MKIQQDAEYQQLMRDLREKARSEGLHIDAEDELYNHFCKDVQHNLHIVFTMNPAGMIYHEMNLLCFTL